MDDQEPKGGYYLRKSQLIAGGVLAGCLCLMVGLMCGLLPQSEICEAPPIEGAAAAGAASDTGVAGDTPKDDVGPGVTVDPEWYELRLPETVKPTHYHLLLHPNLTTNYFTGEVQIEVRLL